MTLNLPGVITELAERYTKKDRKAMGVITVEYQGDAVEFVVFPTQWKAYSFLWKEMNVGIFNLTKTEKGVKFNDGQILRKP